jgi:hypothetical protein
MNFHTQPFKVLGYHVIRIFIDLLRIRILETVDQFSAIPFHVFVIQNGNTGMTYVQRTRRSGCYPHDHLFIDIFEGGQFVGTFLLLLHHQIRIVILQFPDLCVRSHFIYLGDEGFYQRQNFGRSAPEFGTFPQYFSDNGFGIGGTFEEYRIL